MKIYKTIKKTINVMNDNLQRKKAARERFPSDLKKQKIILIGSPEHNNLGDHAISIAEMLFLKENFADYNIVELSSKAFIDEGKLLRKYIAKEDKILITGGGFLGNLWIKEEEWVREVLKTFSDNKIVILPQTIYFTDDDDGSNEKEKTEKIYEEHRNLSIFLRDRISYQFVKNNFINLKHIGYAPDFVLYMDYSKQKFDRRGILTCLRCDKEKAVWDEDKLFHYLSDNQFEYKSISTLTEEGECQIARRMEEFDKKIAEFKKAKLVITDRLHAMLFSVITGTPCIAMDNLSRKVSGVYEWICYLPYIKIAASMDEVVELMKQEKFIDENDYNNSCLMKSFKEIKEVILMD